MLQDAQNEGQIEALLNVHAVATGNRQQRPQVAEHDEQREGDDVVGHGVQPHGDDSKDLQSPAVLIVPCQATEQIAEHPRQQGGRGQETDRPRQGARNQRRHRRRERRQRRAEIGHGNASPEIHILLERPAGQSIELPQRLTHHVDRLGRGVAERGDRGNRLLDGINRRRVRDDVGQVDADEHHKQELEKPLRKVLRVETHWRRLAPDPQLFGFNFTNMARELAQFGTGSV